MRAALMALAAVIVVAACGTFTAPSPTPAEMDDVIANLVLRGVTIHDLVSGDAGCPSSELHNNAVHLQVAIGAQSALHDIYLLRWRRQSDFDAATQDFTDCVAEYQSLHPGQATGQVELTPWRAYGPFWTPELDRTVSDALRAAGGGT